MEYAHRAAWRRRMQPNLLTVAAGILSLLMMVAAASAERGRASWYGPGFHGKTAYSGERFNQWALTAAHPSLPMGTKVRVTREEHGSVVVCINDRGPARWTGRIIDLSRGAAARLNMINAGVATVTVTRIGKC